jgi:hypothetical protein
MYGIGSRSRLKLETMFSANSGNVGETTENNSDESKCNIDEDDEKI